MSEMQKCRKCGEIKGLFDFNKDRTKKRGVGSMCKPCASITTHEYYIKNSTHIKRRVSKYNATYIAPYERNVISRLKNLCTKAKGRSKEFSLVDQDLFDLWEKQTGLCAYTKLPMLATSNQFNTISLDRIDSGNGYVVGNIQLVCAAVNTMKMALTEERFIHLCSLVTQNSKLTESPEA